VTGLCKDRHRHQVFLGFLKHVARAYPHQEGVLVTVLSPAATGAGLAQ